MTKHIKTNALLNINKLKHIESTRNTSLEKWNGNSSTQKREVAKHIKHFICYTETKKHFEVLKNTLAEFCKHICPVYFVHFCKQNESNSLYLEI